MTETEFIKQLTREIQIYDTKKHNKLYLRNRNANVYKFNKSVKHITEIDLPIQTLLGSVFLQKGSNIIEFYSYCNHAESPYIEINKTRPVWMCEINIINLDNTDSCNIMFLLDGFYTFYSPSNLQSFILMFLHDKFQLYI
jgi:hypothetical protein